MTIGTVLAWQMQMWCGTRVPGGGGGGLMREDKSTRKPAFRVRTSCSADLRVKDMARSSKYAEPPPPPPPPPLCLKASKRGNYRRTETRDTANYHGACFNNQVAALSAPPLSSRPPPSLLFRRCGKFSLILPPPPPPFQKRAKQPHSGGSDLSGNCIGPGRRTVAGFNCGMCICPGPELPHSHSHHRRHGTIMTEWGTSPPTNPSSPATTMSQATIGATSWLPSPSHVGMSDTNTHTHTHTHTHTLPSEAHLQQQTSYMHGLLNTKADDCSLSEG